MTDSIPLKRVALIEPGQSPPSGDVEPLTSGKPFLQGNAEFGSKYPVARFQCGSARKSSLFGDVLLSIRAPVGALNIADRSYGIGRGLCAVRPRSCDERFLWWWLHAQVSTLDAVATGTTYPAVTAEDVAVLRFPTLPLGEQGRIADYLDIETARIDRLREMRYRQVKLVNERKRSSIARLFATAASGVETRLKRLLVTRPRYGVLVPEFVDEGVPFIRVNDLLELGRRASDLRRIPEALSLKYRSTVVREGDIFVSVVGTLGRVVIADSRVAGANVARAVAVIRVGKDIDRRLMCAWLTCSDFERQALLATGTDSAQPTLGMEDVANFLISWPRCVEEQRRMAREVGVINSELCSIIEALNKQTSLLVERRQALITAAVTGQIDVATARGAAL